MIIWKYVIPRMSINDVLRGDISVPMGAKLLSIKNQNEELVAWFEIHGSTYCAEEIYRFLFIMTGQEVEDEIIKEFQYYDSLYFFEGKLVIHVYIQHESTDKLNLN